LAELRAEHGQVRLDAQLDRLDRSELDVLHAQLVRDLVDMTVEARAFDDEPAQRLPQLDTRGRTRLTAELHDPPHDGDLAEETPIRVGDLRPAGEMHRLRPVEDERAPEMVGHERKDRRETPSGLHEGVPERPPRALVAAPEPAPRATDVPVREVVEVRLEVAHHVG